MDPEGRFTGRERSSVETLIGRLASTYPQIDVCVCLASLAKKVDAREFGFWLFNAVRPQTMDEHTRRPWAILFVIDPTNRGASLTIGYALDPWIGDEILATVLAAAKEEFRSSRWVRGLNRAFDALNRALAEAQRTAWLTAKSSRSNAPYTPAEGSSGGTHATTW
jgi:TPM domain